MPTPISKIVILGGGSAGFLSAVTLKKQLPQVDVQVIYSPDIPVIGVGESTTQAVPTFLHKILRLDRNEFFREVQPSWKLGLRLEWGDPQDIHFNYPFDRFMDDLVPGLAKNKGFYCLADKSDSSLFWALMDRGNSPCVLKQGGHLDVDERAAYHVKNDLFIDYLKRKSLQLGATILKGEVVDLNRHESGEIKSLILSDGQEVIGDLFVDCSGFRSALLGKTLEVPYKSYDDTLYCDSAVIGSWQRDDEVRPYTTVETMNHGWCWRIDFIDVVTRGYVFSSQFCSEEEAIQEIREKNPQLGDDLRVIRFPTGRYERFWEKNVAAVGNAAGFVEPLEATALHLIIEHLRFLTLALLDSDMQILPAVQAMENQRFRNFWDDVRNFLAVHYKYNRKLDTSFWKHCRKATPLDNIAGLIDYYREIGPSLLCKPLIPSTSIFGYNGYMALLVGQRVPTKARMELTQREWYSWDAHRNNIRQAAETALPMREGLQHYLASLQ